MRQNHAPGHEFRGFTGRISVHDPLVSGTAGINALSDIRRLFDDLRDHLQLIIITDVFINLPGDRGRVKIRVSRDLAPDQKQTVAAESLDRDPGGRILPKAGVQTGVRDLVADLVRVSGGNAFDCVEIVVMHIFGYDAKLRIYMQTYEHA